MTSQSAADSPAARLVLVGARGFGAVHAERIARLADSGRVSLVAVVDPAVAAEQSNIYGADLHADLGEALVAVGPVDVVIIAAPIGAHFALARTALQAGADVYLEKPPVTSIEEFRELLALERQTGRVIQVGFQSLGSHALPALQQDRFGIGAPVRVGAVGLWSRTLGYWKRSPWAGRRSLRGRPVIDGVVTNPLAHAVATALAIAGCRELDDVQRVDLDLYRANKIDCDDTSVVRVRTREGLDVTCALTLCAPTQYEPVVHVEGTTGRVAFTYTTDEVRIDTAEGTRSETTGRTDLLENLIAYRRDGQPLLVPLAATGAFMRVLSAVAAAEEPRKVDQRAVTWEGTGDDQHPVIDGIEDWVRRAASTSRTFTELGAPWTHSARDTVLARATVGDREVADYVDGRGTIATSSPRPYFHPVRTRSGLVVSAHHPADHDWHLGVGFAIPDVNGSSFWGGGTYVHDTGYVLIDNHGQVVGEAPEVGENRFTQRLAWHGHDGSILLREERTAAWSALGDEAWRLDLGVRLVAETAVTLHSPGSKGRPGGGYGGFFWRLPPADEVEVFTADRRGEAEVHGTAAPWIAWRSEFSAAPESTGLATLVVRAPVEAPDDPWFVRAGEYAGIGSAVAWVEPVRLAAGQDLVRHFALAIADGRLSDEAVAELAGALTAPV